MIQTGALPPDQSTIYHSFLANSDSSVMSSTGSDVLLNLVNVRPFASVIVGSQPSGNRSSSKNGRSVSMSPPKWVNNVEPLRNIYIISPTSECGVTFTYLELPNNLWPNDMEYCPLVLRASTRLFAEKRARSFLVRQPFSPVPDASNSSIRSGAGLD